MLSGERSGNNYYVWKDSDVCMSVMSSDLELWQMRLCHMNRRSLVKLVYARIVRGIPNIENKTNMVSRACNQGKQIRVHHKNVAYISSKGILDLLHMDLMGPIQVESMGRDIFLWGLMTSLNTFGYGSYDISRKPLIASKSLLFNFK